MASTSRVLRAARRLQCWHHRWKWPSKHIEPRCPQRRGRRYNGKPFENVKRHIKYLSSQQTGWKGQKPLVSTILLKWCLHSCALFLSGPKPVSGTIWEILFSVRWTRKTISNHESVVVYSSIGAIYNERLDQIRIFSSAEPEQKHDEYARQHKTHFEWRNRFNWAELFRFKLKYEIENNGTIVIKRHSTQLLSLSQNALSSLRLSFVGEANGERRRQVTTRSTEQQERSINSCH